MNKALIIVVVVVGFYSLSYAEQPIDVLQKSIDKGITILNDFDYKDQRQKELQRQRLWQELKYIFDFKAFSKRVLARNWIKFSPAQREEFVALFGDFVNVYYLSRLQERYTNEKVTLLEQNLISYSKAVVKASVRWKNQDVPIEIKMLKRDGSWKVYDISALGISAIGFYRGQFQTILYKESPEYVLEKLKEKINASEKKLREK